MRCIIILIINFIFVGLISSQDQSLSQLQQRLRKIQNEIDKLENQLNTKSNQLKIEVASLEKVDKQIGLINNKIYLYQSKIKSKRNSIARLEIKIDSLKQRIRSLQQIFKKQVVFAYKYHRGKHLDWVLGSSNFNDALIRYRYFQKISSLERKTYDDLENSKKRLHKNELELENKLTALEQLLAAAKRENERLNSKHKSKENLVHNIKQSRRLLTNALEDKKTSYRKLSEIIASMERNRPSRELKPKTRIQWENLTGNFSKNKGKLNWPVSGKLLYGFGKVRNRELKTTWKNTGIDIRAEFGIGVRCVFPGVISLITYLSGFGNTVIVDHNDGYYTVYSHLDQIFVNSGEFVEGGYRIGTVGKSGSLEGAKLHFEIYGNNIPLNPLSWLKKIN